MKKFVIKINKELCKGCELCIEFCPKNALEMSKQLNSKGYQYATYKFPDKCIGCKQCAEICPEAAIEIESYEQDTTKESK
jgi:2-oxoglutarate ferredoxin oxidoreductase subunit delta